MSKHARIDFKSDSTDLSSFDSQSEGAHASRAASAIDPNPREGTFRPKHARPSTSLKYMELENEAFHRDASSTVSFKAISPEMWQSHPDFSSLKAVVLGGGTGAPVSIKTLLQLGVQTSAVVAMADDGGSTGILREEAHVTPPGDIRKCLAAFAEDPEDPFTKAFKYRFEFARNHTLGNLMLSALENATGSFPEAIKICGQMLNARGRVYPSTLENVTLCARTREGKTLRGQANACKSEIALRRVWLESDEPHFAYKGAVQAIEEADLLILGPGSLFTSIIPNLCVEGIVEAIERSQAKTVFVCSLADMQGETWGMNAYEHVDALLRHGMEGLLDYVLIHNEGTLKKESFSQSAYRSLANSGILTPRFKDMPQGPVKIRPVHISLKDVEAIQARGPKVEIRNFADPQYPTWHNPQALGNAFTEILKQCLSQQK